MPPLEHLMQTKMTIWKYLHVSRLLWVQNVHPWHSGTFSACILESGGILDHIFWVVHFWGYWQIIDRSDYSTVDQINFNGGGGIGSENNGKKCETINNIFVLLFLLLDGSCKFVMSCLGCGYPVPGTLDTFHQPLRYMICGDDATWMWCNPLQEHRSGGIPFSKDAVAAATGDPLQKFSAAISNLSSTHAWAETQLRRGWVLFLTQKIL